MQEASAKSNLKRVSLELGGKSPFIIFDIDDDGLQKAAEDTANSIFQNQGTCLTDVVYQIDDRFKTNI